MKLTRTGIPLIFDEKQKFAIGKGIVLKEGEDATIIASGPLLSEALKAYDMLLHAQKPIHISVIDLYSIKPFDARTVIDVARASCNTVLTVEDHYIQGGIGEMIGAALCNSEILVGSLAVTELPRSGSPEELLKMAGIDAQSIVDAVNNLIKE